MVNAIIIWLLNYGSRCRESSDAKNSRGLLRAIKAFFSGNLKMYVGVLRDPVSKQLCIGG